jgi:hypothetical protein
VQRYNGITALWQEEGGRAPWLKLRCPKEGETRSEATQFREAEREGKNKKIIKFGIKNIIN